MCVCVSVKLNSLINLVLFRRQMYISRLNTTDTENPTQLPFPRQLAEPIVHEIKHRWKEIYPSHRFLLHVCDGHNHNSNTDGTSILTSNSRLQALQRISITRARNETMQQDSLLQERENKNTTWWKRVAKADWQCQRKLFHFIMAP